MNAKADNRPDNRGLVAQISPARTDEGGNCNRHAGHQSKCSEQAFGEGSRAARRAASPRGWRVMTRKPAEPLDPSPPTIEEAASDTFVRRLYGEWTPADMAALE